MNLSEFKAWFDGFTENIKGEPSSEQWARIKARVSEITEFPTPYPVFIERYYRPYQPHWIGWQYNTNLTAAQQPPPTTMLMNGGHFTAAGRAEAASLS